MSFLVAGRLFYEIDLLDSENDSISFIHFHSALDVVNDFEIIESSNQKLLVFVILVVVLTLIVSVILLVIYLRKKKYKVSEPTQIEINAFKLIKHQ